MPVAPLAAGVIGVLTAAMFALLPTAMLEQMVVDSGIASVLSAAEPPLGFTARAVLILGCGGGVALVAWFALFLLLGSRSVALQRGGEDAEAAPVLRRADAHPDAPARRPLFANRDLGTPFLDVRAKPVHVVADVSPVQPPPPVEQDLPVDLDQPLAAFDPAAVPDQPLDWFPPPAQLTPAAPRRPTFAATERMETFPLAPVARPAPLPKPEPVPVAAAARSPAAPRPDPSDTIHALLDRLERSVGRREEPAAAASPPPPPAREQKLEDTLSTLRKLATRSG